LWQRNYEYQNTFYSQRFFPAAFALKHLVKDLRLAKEAGLDSPLIHPLYDSYAAAEQEGLGDQDVMAIISSLKK
jgi:3-hydroxyisobutyrate dehydrogenase